MSLFESIIIGFFEEVVIEILGIFPGSMIRWVFIKNKYTFKECIKKGRGWNFLISITFWILIFILISN